MLVLMTFHQSLKFLCSFSFSLSSPATVPYDGWVPQTLIKTELSRQPQLSNNHILVFMIDPLIFFTSKEIIRIGLYSYELNLSRVANSSGLTWELFLNFQYIISKHRITEIDSSFLNGCPWVICSLLELEEYPCRYTE